MPLPSSLHDLRLLIAAHLIAFGCWLVRDNDKLATALHTLACDLEEEARNDDLRQ